MIFIVDVDGRRWISFLKHLDKLHRLVLNDCREEGLMEPVDVFPVIFPERGEDAPFFFFPGL